MEKQYGKLTIEQFHAFMGRLLELLQQLQEATELLASAPASMFDSVMVGGIGDYCHAYKRPLHEFLAMVIVAIGRQDELEAFVSAADPQQSLLDSLDLDAPGKPHDARFPLQLVMAWCHALGRSVQSIVTYGRSISGLFQDVRERGDVDALFKAIRMHRLSWVHRRPWN